MTEGDLSGAVLDGRYKVIAPIAEGAMGVVYRAERLKLGRIVAVKVLHDTLPNELSSRKRFELEAMAMAKLEHPHCASVLDVGLHDGKPFVVMDFVSGEDLKSLIAKGPVAVPRALEILRQVLSGLAHAHELGIIHRDIKPANIILSQKAGLGDHAKILDFGLARLAESQGANLTTGIVVGTPAYMAPEQIRGTLIDGRVDLYACGVLLVELVTGRKPFHSAKDDPIEVVTMHLKNPVPRLADLMPGTDFGELEAVAAKALAKQADDRYQTATEMVAALDAVGRGKPAAAHGESAVMPLATRDLAIYTEGEADSLAIPQQASAPAATPHAGTRLGLAVVAEAAPAMPSAPVVQPLAPAPASAPITVQGIGPVPASGPVVAPTAVDSQAAIPTTRQRPPSPSLTSAPAAALPMKKLALAGGALLLVIIVIAVVASGRSKGTTADAAVATGSAATEPPHVDMDPSADALARAQDLAARGDREAALDLLVKARRDYPDAASLPLLAGKLYFAKLWWTDGLQSFRDAIRLDPQLQADPELIKTVLKGFITTPRYNAELADFLHDVIGPGAAAYLEETAKGHPNAAIRGRAEAELRRYR